MNHSVSGRSLVQVVLGLIVVSTAVANSAIGLGLEFNADSSPDDGVTILENPERVFDRVSIDGVETIAPLPHSDYFSRHGIVFQVERAWPGEPEPVYIVIEHLDRGIALIDVSASFEGKELPVTPIAGYTALDSGQIRRALFSMPEPPPPGTRFEVVGVSALTKLTVVPGNTPELVEAVVAEIPVAKPKLSLQRPIQLVTTAGVNPRGDMDLDATLHAMRELSPVARALGFTAVESYVRWNFVEPERDRFDWSFYDAIVNEAQRHHLQWFPLLIVGSAYALPPWFKNSEENVGFVCLEHGERNNIQTIFADIQR
ncbi:MAG: beta-galactosidase, partial [Candidatus Hydrogenedentes bacterium]|nr:beta-galactosidase [Candidatus Hydrogenedentota bacterium]